MKEQISVFKNLEGIAMFEKRTGLFITLRFFIFFMNSNIVLGLFFNCNLYIKVAGEKNAWVFICLVLL